MGACPRLCRSIRLYERAEKAKSGKIRAVVFCQLLVARGVAQRTERSKRAPRSSPQRKECACCRGAYGTRTDVQHTYAKLKLSPSDSEVIWATCQIHTVRLGKANFYFRGLKTIEIHTYYYLTYFRPRTKDERLIRRLTHSNRKKTIPHLGPNSRHVDRGFGNSYFSVPIMNAD